MQPQQVVADQDLPGHLIARADADHGDARHAGLQDSRDFHGHALHHQCDGAGSRNGLRITDQVHGGARSGALHAQTTLEEGALGLQTDVAHDGDACALEGANHGSHMAAALHLHHVRPGLAKVRRVAQRVGLQQVGAERHVPNYHGLGRRCDAVQKLRRCVDAPAHGSGGTEHVIHSHAHGVGQAQAAVPQRVAHQHQLHPSIAGCAGRGEVVGRDHGELLAALEAAGHPGEPQWLGCGSQGGCHVHRGNRLGFAAAAAAASGARRCGHRRPVRHACLGSVEVLLHRFTGQVAR